MRPSRSRSCAPTLGAIDKAKSIALETATTHLLLLLVIRNPPPRTDILLWFHFGKFRVKRRLEKSVMCTRGTYQCEISRAHMSEDVSRSISVRQAWAHSREQTAADVAPRFAPRG